MRFPASRRLLFPLALLLGEVTEDLALRHPPRADCTRYDSLRGLHAAA